MKHEQRRTRGGAANTGSRRDETASPAPLSSTAPEAPAWLRALAGVLIAATALAVYRGGLAYFFAQDDFAGLARARELAPRLTEPWRYISGQFYFDLMAALAGLDPRPYHAVSLALHAGVSLLVWRLIGPRAGWIAALLGAAWYASHPAHFTAVYSVSGIGELLSAAGAIGTLLLLRTHGAARWAAVPAFALSLLSKETSLLIPLVALCDARARGATPGIPARAAWRDPVWQALAALMLVQGLLLIAGDAFGVRQGLARDAAYSVGVGPHVLANLLTYTGWSRDIAVFMVQGFSDAVDPAMRIPGAIGLAALAAGFAWRPLRERGWLAATALYLLPLLPVLGLRHHVYHYYLYLPLAGLAWGVAALFDAATTRLLHRTPRVRLASALAMTLGLAINGVALVHKIETMPFITRDMRSDPTVDRARIARRVRDGLAAAEFAQGDTLVMWMPRVFQPALAAPFVPERDTYWETNLRSALLDGLAVRVLFPDVAAVRFVRGMEPMPPRTPVAVCRADGFTQVRPAADLERMLRAQPEIR